MEKAMLHMRRTISGYYTGFLRKLKHHVCNINDGAAQITERYLIPDRGYAARYCAAVS